MNALQTTTGTTPTTLPQGGLILQIGRYGRIPVKTAEEASRAWSFFRDALDLGGSDSPYVLLKHGHKTVGYVSYNGRIWKGRPDRPVAELNKSNPIAEAADIRAGIRVGDWLPVEDMEEERFHLGKVVATYPDRQAISLDLADGTRLYLQAGKLHDRYFTFFNTVAA